MYRRLHDAKKTLEQLRNSWDVPSTVWLDRADHKWDEPWDRPREIGEYPENTRAAWRNTYHVLGFLIAELQGIRNLAGRRYNELPKSGAAQSAEQSGVGDE